MKKKFFWLVLSLMTLFLVACGGGEKKEETTDSANANTEISGKIVIYTSMYEDIIDNVSEKLKKEFPNLEVEFFQGGTGTLQSKIIAELQANKLGCDMLMVAEPSYSLELKEKDNKFYGDNTDYYGFKYTLTKNDIDVKNKKIAIIGKGGASASVYKVLKDMEAEDITFYFRKNKLSKIEFPENIGGDIIINTTPVGMFPNVEDNLVSKEILKKFKIAIDLIYNPLETKFLKEAKECGLKTINGLDMLIEQALKTDEILYGILLSTQLKKKIRKKIKKKVEEFYENNGN